MRAEVLVTDDEDTERSDIRSGNLATLVTLYRTLGKMQRECELLRRATSERNTDLVARSAGEATHRWFAAKAVLQRLERRGADVRLHLDTAQAGVAAFAHTLISLLRTASRRARTPELRRALMRQRFCVLVASAAPPVHRASEPQAHDRLGPADDRNRHRGERRHAHGS